jgi:ubiquinone/menaquinone biosynthesis C-methylase UbiE
MNEGIRRWAKKLAKPIHVRLRSLKVELFRQHLSSKGLPLLDVGGGAGIDGEFLRLYTQFSRVVIANLKPSFHGLEDQRVSKIVPDGRQLPFPDKSFDWVISNVVIEHVGDWADQKSSAQEIRRVASCGYFVTTTDWYFPLEPHTFLPFYQFLPVSVQRRGSRYSPGYVREYEQITLLSAAHMRPLFPDAKVIPTGFSIVGNSLNAYCDKGWLHAHGA